VARGPQPNRGDKLIAAAQQQSACGYDTPRRCNKIVAADAALAQEATYGATVPPRLRAATKSL